MQTLSQALAETQTFLLESDTPQLDAQVLLAHILSKPRPWVIAHPEAALSSQQQHALDGCLARLGSGEPLPYVLGDWEFFGLDFIVTPDVLIPRPETELLVERALVWLRRHPQSRKAADVGAGSGCIALALAANCPGLHVWAGDISTAALEVARANARKHSLAGQIELVQSDLLLSASRPFDLVAANLPYIPTGTMRDLPIFGREPTLALDGGADGLAHIRRLFKQAARLINSPGLLLVEIEATQGQAALSLAQAAFPSGQVQLLQDLAGCDRLVEVNI